jgi:Acetyltransferase (GNAT) domain
MKCEIIDFEKADFRQLDSFADRTVFQTREWVHFVAETHGAAPILTRLTDSGKTVGYFTGLTFTRLGIRVLGSSFPGWATPYMGFNLVPGASRAEALAAVEQVAWNELKCLHMEVSDPHFDPEDGKALGFKTSYYISYRTDLTKTEDELFQSMDSACRRCVRKAEKSGLIIEEAHDLAFADEYYEQLKDVFAKQGLVSTYDVERVRALVRNMEPSGNVLLLRARNPEGKCIASGIFPGFNQIVEFWGNASFRAYQGFRPNELIQWYVMRYWKNRGATIYDWGGEGTYKEKYGCAPHRVPWFIKSRYEFVGKLRDGAKKMHRGKQRLMGWWQGDRTAVAGE